MKLSRRSFLTVPLVPATARIPPATAQPVTPASYDHPDPLEIGDGLRLTDYRPILTSEPHRFIVEIQSDRDDFIDAPTIGAIFRNAPAESDFAWAVPWHPVLVPGGSTFCIGSLPYPEISAEQIQFLDCGNGVTQSERAQRLESWETDLEYVQNLVDDEPHLALTITNTGGVHLAGGEIRTVVRDTEGRICGAAPLTNMYNLQPGLTVERSVTLQRHWSAAANPFRLCPDPEHMVLTPQVQPRANPTPAACPVIMPWNRDD